MKTNLALIIHFYGAPSFSAIQFPLPDFEFVEEPLLRIECKDFQYANLIYYLVDQVNELAGIYRSEPNGWSIDTFSREINLATHETELSYHFFYSEEGSIDSSFNCKACFLLHLHRFYKNAFALNN